MPLGHRENKQKLLVAKRQRMQDKATHFVSWFGCAPAMGKARSAFASNFSALNSLQVPAGLQRGALPV